MKTLFTFIILITMLSGQLYAGYYNPQNPNVSLPEPQLDKNSGNKTLNITPIESCYTKLSKEESEDIKRHYTKPYSECLKRVAEKEKSKNSIKFDKTEQNQLDKSNITTKTK